MSTLDAELKRVDKAYQLPWGSLLCVAISPIAWLLVGSYHHAGGLNFWRVLMYALLTTILPMVQLVALWLSYIRALKHIRNLLAIIKE